MTPELVTLAGGALTATVNPLGAELWSLTDADGRELMTDADPRWWTGHAPNQAGDLHGQRCQTPAGCNIAQN